MSDEPKTLAEKLDAAQTGEQFGNALLGFMAAMDRERFIQLKPAPTDEELQAERDRKHAAAVKEWIEDHPDMDNGNDSAIAMAYSNGWYGAFAEAQKELARLISKVDGIQKTVLIVTSERLALIANGRGNL